MCSTDGWELPLLFVSLKLQERREETEVLLLGGLIQSSLLISFTSFWMLEMQALKEAIIDEYLEGEKK